MLFHRLSGTLLLGMTVVELLRAFVQAPELSSVGGAQERAAFIAIRIDGRTVREVGQTLGVSKSQIPNLVDRFQEKLAARMMELKRKRIEVSAEYRALHRDLYGWLCDIRSDDDWWGGHKIGNFDTGAVSREGWAEITGKPLRFQDE